MRERLARSSHLLPQNFHTPGHVNCAVCMESRNRAMRPEIFGTLLFPVAAEVWLNSRLKLSPDSVKDYKKCIKALNGFFSQLKLYDIHIGHVQEYQKARRSFPTRCNRELNVTLKQILNRGGDLWNKNIEPYYEAVPIEKHKPGMALEPEEERHFFLTATKSPRWLVAYCAGVLARNTCLGTKEVRCIQLKNVDLQECKWVRVVEHVKNEFRPRTLACNEDAAWALRQLILAGKKRGAFLPEHYLMPGRARKGEVGFDPNRPCTNFYKAWYAIREEAGKKYPRLLKLQFYDMRRTANTRLLENPDIPYNAIEHFMGHEVNSKTKRLYDYIRGTTLSNTAAALSSGHSERKSNLAFIEPRPAKETPSDVALELARLLTRLMGEKHEVESLLKKPPTSANR